MTTHLSVPTILLGERSRKGQSQVNDKFTEDMSSDILLFYNIFIIASTNVFTDVSVMQVSAKDPDDPTTLNGIVRYKLVGQEPSSDAFRIDPVTGNISVASVGILDREVLKQTETLENMFLFFMLICLSLSAHRLILCIN